MLNIWWTITVIGRISKPTMQQLMHSPVCMPICGLLTSQLLNLFCERKTIVEKLRRDRYKAHLQERESAETERINTQALQFIDLIEPQKETYEQTCARLKKAIGARIDQKVFHAAVRTIRFKYADTHK